MNTLYINSSEPGAAEKAAEILQSGGIVAIPTETVYGLAANALDPGAVKKIFEAKGRPQDNPLIVHVSSLEEIPPLVSKISPALYPLAEKFWPGPLTLIMKKSDLVPDEVTAGLDTVAIRMPSHPAAREIIRKSGLPLAAPSANASGRPSPTKASHVKEDLDGRIDAVIDGGDCSVGVESTVISLVSDPPVLLRPGGISPAQLEEVLGKIEISHAVFEKLAEGEKAQSPGMKYKHYAPKAKVTLIKGSFEKYKKFLLAQKTATCAVCFEGEGKYFEHSLEYGIKGDAGSQAEHIFDALRRVDETGCENAFVRFPDMQGVGLAVYNRLLRSAAFNVIDLDFTRPVYGLTGPTGAGKTTIGEVFSSHGCNVIDTDLLARKAVENPQVIKDISESFGADLFESGNLNRRELARRAFSSPENTMLLNKITHPEITKLTIEEIHLGEGRGAKASVIDAPVLFESPLTAVCDKIICVTAPEEERIKRISLRDGITEQEARVRVAAQKSISEYAALSDVIIENTDPVTAAQAAGKFITEELK
ncbi:MAG: threonylcarbamoyl-AMP synthase [Clostridia bacterium]|nr:threonylcarbamoyl-AMP synthase [Clostridia bacterium]